MNTISNRNKHPTKEMRMKVQWRLKNLREFTLGRIVNPNLLLYEEDIQLRELASRYERDILIHALYRIDELIKE